MSARSPEHCWNLYTSHSPINSLLHPDYTRIHKRADRSDLISHRSTQPQQQQPFFASNRVKRSLVAKANNPLCTSNHQHLILVSFSCSTHLHRRKSSQPCISTLVLWRGAWSPSSSTRRSMYSSRSVSSQVSCLSCENHVGIVGQGHSRRVLTNNPDSQSQGDGRN